MPGVKVEFDIVLRIITKRRFGIIDQELMRKAIYKQIYMSLKSYETSRIIPLGKIAMEIIDSSPEIIGLASTSSSAPNFESVHVRKNYTEEAISSDRKQVIKELFRLEEDEFCRPGSITVKFEEELL